MHLYDLMENSTAAHSTEVRLSIRDSLKDDLFHFTIEDNGCGMSPELLARATDPYTTSRTTRKVGLGLPLIKLNTERCDGATSISSTAGVGTRLEFHFRHSHIDRPPMGDLAGSLVLFLAAHPDLHFVISYTTDVDSFTLDTDDLRDALGAAAVSNIHVMTYLKEIINQNLVAIHANE